MRRFTMWLQGLTALASVIYLGARTFEQTGIFLQSPMGTKPEMSTGGAPLWLTFLLAVNFVAWLYRLNHA
jgi:hypothetical protein